MNLFPACCILDDNALSLKIVLKTSQLPSKLHFLANFSFFKNLSTLSIILWYWRSLLTKHWRSTLIFIRMPAITTAVAVSVSLIWIWKLCLLLLQSVPCCLKGMFVPVSIVFVALLHWIHYLPYWKWKNKTTTTT